MCTDGHDAFVSSSPIRPPQTPATNSWYLLGSFFPSRPTTARHWLQFAPGQRLRQLLEHRTSPTTDSQTTASSTISPSPQLQRLLLYIFSRYSLRLRIADPEFRQAQRSRPHRAAPLNQTPDLRQRDGALRLQLLRCLQPLRKTILVGCAIWLPGQQMYALVNRVLLDAHTATVPKWVWRLGLLACMLLIEGRLRLPSLSSYYPCLSLQVLKVHTAVLLSFGILLTS